MGCSLQGGLANTIITTPRLASGPIIEAAYDPSKGVPRVLDYKDPHIVNLQETKLFESTCKG